jgi:DNA adenine methylase Dam
LEDDFVSYKYIKSPLNYTGGKYRLLKKIIPLFPNKIDTFVDLFGGAMNVCVNIEANKIYGNDYIHYLPTLFNTWKGKTLDDINQYIDSRIKEFGLSGENYDSFIKFRKQYNNTKSIEDLFILICHSFNFQMRFNNSHEYNSSFGKVASTMNPKIRQNLNIFVKTIKEKDITFTNKDFREFNFQGLGENDLVYCDPPYFISCGVYQDGKRGFGGWTKKDDSDLMELLDKLNSLGIKFAMSNVFENKGLVHDDLINWSKKYNVHHLDMNYNSANYQRESSKSDEVLITNY